MLQVHEMRFHYANGLAVLRICAPIEEHLLQKMRFVGSAGFRGGSRGPGPGPPTMFMRLAICATCTHHLVIFSEESLFVGAIN